MFRDEASIEVIAGKGGDGLASFHREKYIQHGGPDGGDGGDGGSVFLCATSRVHSLLNVGRQYRYAAKGGRPGATKKRAGKRGADIQIEVPIGTLIYDDERGHLLRDLNKDGDTLEVARGGRGGAGNTHFATSIRQVPEDAKPGKPGETRKLRLELRLFAEVGLLGFPNAGKSTFLSVVTSARPKVANYPFTTIEPQVGIARVGTYDSLVLADLPGLIEGAAEGVGLGHQFLRHVQRCGVLLHLVDVSESAEHEPLEAVQSLEAELERYSAELFKKPRIVVATKVEDEGARTRASELSESLGAPVLEISSQESKGLREVLESARRLCRPDEEAPFEV